MRSRWLSGAAVALATAGCAAIVGLGDPTDPVPAGVVDSAPADSSPVDDGGVTSDAPIVTDIGYGSGRDGPLVISDRRPLNDYAPLAKRGDVGAKSLTLGKRDSTVTTQTVKAGDVLLVVQSASPGSTAPYDTSPLDSDVGTWELVHARSVTGDVVELSVPLTRAFAVPGSQVVRVTQATILEVAAAGAISAPRWDGLTGGIIAVLATEAVIASGSIDANNIGYRGARAAQVQYFNDCQANEGLVDAGFAPRGEGFGSADAGYGGLTGGRGNASGGGGGGDCHNAGGGGGGNAGRGGVGGLSLDNARAVGGLGGAALRVPPGVARLRFGGGGGAGEANDGNAGSGGTGGGVVFIRAPKLTGAGSIQARGGGGSTANSDGAGGGGAGGTIYLDVMESPLCKVLGITGGGGGNTVGGNGPGGAGGGGLVFVRGGSPVGCPIESQAGAAGKENNVARGAGPPDDERGAPKYAGIVSGDLAP